MSGVGGGGSEPAASGSVTAGSTVLDPATLASGSVMDQMLKLFEPPGGYATER